MEKSGKVMEKIKFLIIMELCILLERYYCVDYGNVISFEIGEIYVSTFIYKEIFI